jgi:hypothetical protein
MWKLDPLAGRDRAAASLDVSSAAALHSSTHGRSARPIHRAGLLAVCLGTMFAFALPANVEYRYDLAGPEPASAPDPAATTTKVHVVEVQAADTPRERPPTTAFVPTPAWHGPARAAAQRASTQSPERPRVKLAQSAPARHSPAGKGATVNVAQAQPASAPPVPPAPPVLPAPQTVAEAAIPAQPRQASSPRDVAVTAFNEALEQCAERSVFARSWCEHRARTRYCDAEGRSRPECTVVARYEHGG